jgi:cytochrome P450
VSVPVVDLMSSDFLGEDRQGYSRLREQAPVVPVRLPGVETPVWLITRYHDVKAALTDPRFVMNRNNVPGEHGPSVMDEMMDAFGVPDEYREYLSGLLSMDGKDHALVRSLVAPAFTAARTEAMRAQVEQIADQLVETLKEKKEVDIIEDFSMPMAGTIICELIGVDEVDRPEVRKWIHTYSSGDPTRMLDSANRLVAYTKDLIKRRRDEPTDDLISKLILTADEDGDRLSEAEMMAMVFLLIHTGHHTTSHFIPNAVLTLLDHPDQLARLHKNRDLLPGAVNELLRFANPVVLGTMMYAAEDLEFGGAQIKQGDTVTVCLLSANRDPRAFEDSDRFDISRKPATDRNHLTFSHGPHYCLASLLARLESEVALDRLCLRLEHLSLAIDRNEIAYHPHPGGILLSKLPVCVGD